MIFPTGTYYPQVHPQVVENPLGLAEDLWPNIVTCRWHDLVGRQLVLIHRAFEPDSFVLARGGNGASAPSGTVL